MVLAQCKIVKEYKRFYQISHPIPQEPGQSQSSDTHQVEVF